jgi:hypothetical protein
MRDRALRAAALLIGLGAIPVFIFDVSQLLKAWPPVGILPERCIGFVFMIGIVVPYGLGLEDRLLGGKSAEKSLGSSVRWWRSQAVYRVGMLWVGVLALLYLASGIAMLTWPGVRPPVTGWHVVLAVLRITWGVQVFSNALRRVVRGRSRWH